MISVIIPTYNRSTFVLDAVKSVLKQTYRNIEVIVIDDGSTDNTGEEIKTIHDKRLRYFKSATNRGVSAARNSGIDKSRGEYISFLDSDDTWKKRKLEIQMDHIEKNGIEQIYYTNERWIKNGKFLNQKKKHKKESGWLFKRFLPLCLVSMSTLTLHKSIFKTVGRFDETLPAAEDYDFFIRAATHYRFYFIDQPLVIKHGGHPDQLTRILPALDQYRIRALIKNYLTLNLTEEKKESILSVLEKKCSIMGTGCIKHGKKKTGGFYISLPEKIKNRTIESYDDFRMRIS